MDERTFRQALEKALAADRLQGSDLFVAQLYLAGTVPFDQCYATLAAVVSSAQARVPTTLDGDLVIGNKLVQHFYGEHVPIDGAVLLQSYLQRVLNDNNRLRFAGQSLSGRGESKAPALKLSEVFQQLVVDGPAQQCGRTHIRTVAQARRISARYRPKSATDVVPDAVRLLDLRLVDELHKAFLNPDSLDSLAADTLVQVRLTRPTLARELPLLAPQRWVLLGAPGSGKSTLLRHVAVSLATQAFNQPEHPPLVPIICSLPEIAQAFPERYNAAANIKALKQVIRDQLEEKESLVPHTGLSRYLDQPLKHGRVLLLFDGLDELPPAPLDDHTPSLRTQAVAAVTSLGEQWSNAPMIVTCRSLAYPVPEDTPLFNHWSLPHPWQTRTVQPFGAPQIRAFVQAWYGESACKEGALYDQAQSSARAAQLLQQIAERELGDLAASPLLLTMLTILHYNSERALLPDSETRLYEEWVDLLLERWHAFSKRKNLIEQMELQRAKATAESLRHLLQHVAYQAHKHPQRTADGRGILSSFELDGLVFQWLCRIEQTERLDQRVAIFKRYIQADAGLLEATDDDGYAFPHLTFQEYLAACYLAEAADPVEEAYKLWSSTNGDRWRKVLELFAGILRDRGMAKNVGKHWLDTLLSKESELTQQLQRDAVLADRTYHLLGGDGFARDLEQLEILHPTLAARLAHILADQPLAPLEDRLAAGFALNHYGDPRPGVATLEPHWCHIPAGTYFVGSDDNDVHAYADEKPMQQVQLEAFSIAAYPVTNAQFRMFVEAGGYHERRWWSDAGWAWLQPQEAGQKIELAPGHSYPIDVVRGTLERLTTPRYWHETRWNQPNQPLVGISLYEALAYCEWLSQQLGYEVTLPAEAQWEVAARGVARSIYPWGNRYDGERVCAEQDVKTGRTYPVGCYPDGCSWNGAYDMAGNVWEWTLSDFNNPDRTNRLPEVDIISRTLVSIRGGAWPTGPRFARSASRNNRHPYYGTSTRVSTSSPPLC